MKNNNFFIRAAILWAIIPYAILKKIFQHWKIVLPICGVIMFFVFLSFDEVTEKTTVKIRQVPEFEFQIIDLTAAFETGVKKGEQNKYIIIHHTGSNGNNKISTIARKHLGENQWAKIGYHYYIDENNEIWQLLPENESAPNAYHRNNDAVAICIAGNYSQKRVSEDTYQLLAKLCKDVMRRNEISLENILRHCDVPDNATECCGKNFDLKYLKLLIKN